MNLFDLLMSGVPARYPELKLNHYHSYEEGFNGRRPLKEVVEELDPDWAHG